MKRFISILLFAAIALSILMLPSCSDKEDEVDDTTPLKFGLGIKHTAESPTSAKSDKNGKGQLTTTAAAVLLDSDGRIVKCVIDTSEAIAEYTSAGKYIAGENFKTKYELGNDYGLKSASGVGKEWYEQIDAFTKLVKGKNIEEVRALVTDGGNGTRDVTKVGCTIVISDFVYALEEAMKAASDSDATSASSLSLKISIAQSGKDSSSGADGYNELKASISATASDKDGKSLATRNGTAEAKYIFNEKGEVKTSG